VQAFTAKPLLQGNQFDIRVELVQPLPGDLRFGLVDILGGKEDLPLQVAEMHLVVVGQHQRADACACQIKRGGAPSPPRPTISTRLASSFCCPSMAISSSRI
jgi:hypothetical protein